jgi:hypothetical protein
MHWPRWRIAGNLEFAGPMLGQRAEQRAAKNGGPDRTSYEGSRAAGACEAPPEGNSSGFDYTGLSGPDWTGLRELCVQPGPRRRQRG